MTYLTYDECGETPEPYSFDHAFRAAGLMPPRDARDVPMPEGKRTRGAPVATGPDARIYRRWRCGRSFIEAGWVGRGPRKRFSDTEEGWEAARAWRDSQFEGG